jgi:hypothetical protein
MCKPRAEGRYVGRYSVAAGDSAVDLLDNRGPIPPGTTYEPATKLYAPPPDEYILHKAAHEKRQSSESQTQCLTHQKEHGSDISTAYRCKR